MSQKITFFAVALIAFILAGCANPGTPGSNDTSDDSKESGLVQFSYAVADEPVISKITMSAPLLSTSEAAKSIVISVEDEHGAVIYSNKQIKLFNFSGSYISEAIAFKTGSYRLTEYLVTDASGDVIYATPKEGSDTAHLVKDPLPSDKFTVTKDASIKIQPEVLDTTSHTPTEFGYTTFSFKVVKTFDFYTTVMIYDESSDNFVTTNAALDVTIDSRNYNFSLINSTNKISINDIAGNYNLTITKAGYKTHTISYTNDQMKAFFTSPLIVTLEKEVHTIPRDGLILEMLFNGNANDTSGYNNNGTVHGATLIADRKGNPNSAYSFDGVNDWIDIANNPSLNPSNQITVSLWYTATKTWTGRGNDSVLTKGHTTHTAPYYQYHLGISSPLYNNTHPKGSIAFYFSNGSELVGAGMDNFWDFNTLYHIVGVCDGNSVSLYVNGTLIKKTVSATPITNIDFGKNVSLGKLSNYDHFLPGTIDDVRIYNRDLSEAEILQLYSE